MRAARSSAVLVAVPVALSSCGVTAHADESLSGYPVELAQAPPGNLSDPAGYPNRECESFVSAKSGWRITLADWGWAPNWGNHAVYSTVPAPDSIAWYNDRPGGHVAWVDWVNPDGSCVIEEMNRDFDGGYTVEVITPGHHWPTGFLTQPSSG